MASVDPALLAILACPRCRGRVAPAGPEGNLWCERCEHSYLVNAEGVPIMTVEDD